MIKFANFPLTFQTCGKAFPNKHPLKRHIHQAHVTKSLKYVVKKDTDMTCMLCKIVLKNRKSYRNHVKNKHQKWLDVIFPKVEKQARQMVKIIPDIEDPSCPCVTCGKIFKNKSKWRFLTYFLRFKT